jgi:hypothetical protein
MFFWWEGFEAALGPERRETKGGLIAATDTSDDKQTG